MEGFEGFFFFIIQNCHHLKELKTELVGIFWRVYINFSNSFYVVIILKLYWREGFEGFTYTTNSLTIKIT